ncbi:hypothetical protein ATO10_14884 [Actibacterium atlanticum]|uniref:Transmembrane protein n=1 Tax=Actibacterium atlanticum TaxID=1461693 RepID=A0A058ZJF4_9RHOB|nr:hypothetical protein ATO10_14884 [Actibacterium atlanticum]
MIIILIYLVTLGPPSIFAIHALFTPDRYSPNGRRLLWMRNRSAGAAAIWLLVVFLPGILSFAIYHLGKCTGVNQYFRTTCERIPDDFGTSAAFWIFVAMVLGIVGWLPLFGLICAEWATRKSYRARQDETD